MQSVNQEKKVQAAAAAMVRIERKLGHRSILRLADAGTKEQEEVLVISTGSLGLDLALGTGGLPRGRMVEVFGPPASGKTTLALSVIAEAQRAGGICAFIDAEHALDVPYARKLGVRASELLVAQPDCGEQALELTEMLVRLGALDVVVIDSVAALVPRAELEGEMGETQPGLHARLMSQALRRLAAAFARSRTLVIFTNQLRVKLGVLFGNPETTTGGHALHFYASVRLEVRRVGMLREGEDVIGSRTRVKVVKNRLAAPFREAEFDLRHGQGISRAGELVDLGLAAGLLAQEDGWITCEGTRLGQGREAARRYLVEQKELARSLKARLFEAPRRMAA